MGHAPAVEEHRSAQGLMAWLSRRHPCVTVVNRALLNICTIELHICEASNCVQVHVRFGSLPSLRIHRTRDPASLEDDGPLCGFLFSLHMSLTVRPSACGRGRTWARHNGTAFRSRGPSSSSSFFESLCFNAPELCTSRSFISCRFCCNFDIGSRSCTRVYDRHWARRGWSKDSLVNAIVGRDATLKEEQTL